MKCASLCIALHNLVIQTLGQAEAHVREFLIACGVQPRAGGAQDPLEHNLEELFHQMPIAALASLLVISPHALHHQLFTFVYFAAPLCISTFVFLQCKPLAAQSQCFTYICIGVETPV